MPENHPLFSSVCGDAEASLFFCTFFRGSPCFAGSLRLSECTYSGEEQKQQAYRTIPLSPSAIHALRNLIARADLNVEIDDVSGFVSAKNGSECKAGDIQRQLKDIIRRLRKKNPSFPDVTPHVLRHTFCTNLFRLGVNPKAIQKIMGHAKISTTLDVYTHMEDEVLRKQIGELGNSISFIGTRHEAAEALPDSKEVDDLQFTPFASKDMNRSGGIRL